MIHAAMLVLLAVTVRQGGVVVREGCSAQEAALATLAAGQTVEIRFAVADGSDCFKISAGSVVGYVPRAALDGLDSFEAARRSAADAADLIRLMKPSEPVHASLQLSGGEGALSKAWDLMDRNQPGQALDVLAPVLRQNQFNPDVLLLAGLASYKSDDPRGALDYWGKSLAIRNNDTIAKLYSRVEREIAADKSGAKLIGLHVSLRYEGQSVGREAAGQMLAALDEEYARIAGQLGCSVQERIVAVAQSRDAYLRSTGAAEWSGGVYDGRIRVALMERGSPGPATRKVFAHEIVHACLQNIGNFPAWVHEGLAQKLSGEELSAEARENLRSLARGGKLPKLAELKQSWQKLSDGNARTAYALSLAAAEILYSDFAQTGVRNVLSSPSALERVEQDLDARLRM